MSVAADLATAVEMWDLTGDLTTYVTAIGQMFAEVEAYALDTNTVVGWQPLWDYNTAPPNALPWICMVVGEQAPEGATDAQLRTLIQTNPNQWRGTPRSIANAVQQQLTGAQIIGFAERTMADGTPNDDWLGVFTYVSETPNQNAVLGALRRTVPADINIAYECITGPTWSALETGDSHGSWSSIYARYGTIWAEIENTAPGYVIYD